jgi:hypothetical protein
MLELLQYSNTIAFQTIAQIHAVNLAQHHQQLRFRGHVMFAIFMVKVATEKLNNFLF